MRLSSLKSDLVKTVLSGSVLLSLVVGFLCIGFILAMPAHANMDMSTMTKHAPHTAGSINNCCDTRASDHMELWKGTLVGIPQMQDQLFALVAVALFLAFTITDFSSTRRLHRTFFYTRFRQYARAHPNIKTYNALRLAFASGILHPKTF